MIAIGIDPGTRNLGWGVVRSQGSRLEHLGHGVVRMDAEAALSMRLRYIADHLEQILVQYRPAVGSVEGIFFDKNAQSAAKLGHARGVVLLCLERAGVAVREHSPARVKRTLTGSGSADKAQVAKMVCAILGLPVLPAADAADALAIAITELRLDPRAHAFSEAVLSRRRPGKLPPHLVAAVQRFRAGR